MAADSRSGSTGATRAEPLPERAEEGACHRLFLPLWVNKAENRLKYRIGLPSRGNTRVIVVENPIGLFGVRAIFRLAVREARPEWFRLLRTVH